MKTRPRTSRRRRRATEQKGIVPAIQLEEDLESLRSALRPYEIEILPEAADRLLRFSRELLLWNDRLNLLSRPDAPNVIRKHVSASLGVLLLARPSPGSRWLDVGTGAGFPGLVLKCVLPDLDITLLDSARKRCIFLEKVSAALHLEGVPILQLRAETLIAKQNGSRPYDVLTTRAVAALADSLEQFGALVAPNGRFVTFKGPQWQQELADARNRGIVSRAGFELESAIRIPWTQGHLLSFQRVAH